MPRYKMTKTKKQTIKKRRKASSKKTNNKMVNIPKMESELLKAPARIAAKLDKEIKSLKKQEMKLNKACNKMNRQLDKAETRMQAAKTKTRLKAAEKMHKQASKAYAASSKQLEEVTSKLQGLTSTQDRLIALGKAIKQFNADWGKAKPRKMKKSQSSNVEPLHTADDINDAAVDEVTELAS
jgi:predicted  nucleic acid-binding Zn-ribbon protein